MPLLRQLEFAFGRIAVAGIIPAASSASLVAGVNAPGYNNAGRSQLEETARDLLRAQSAQSESRTNFASNGIRASKQLLVALIIGEKLISLNPRLFEHPSEIDRTLRHELAHILAQFRVGRRKISPHGDEWQQACIDLGIADEKRCHNLPFPARTYARAVCLSLSELSSGVSASTPRAPRSRLSCLLP